MMTMMMMVVEIEIRRPSRRERVCGREFKREKMGEGEGRVFKTGEIIKRQAIRMIIDSFSTS